MVASVILISYDSSEESVGSSTSQEWGSAGVAPPPVGVHDLTVQLTSETNTKILHPFPTRIPANRRRFLSSSSSPPCKRRRVSPCSSLSPTHSSSPVSRLRDPSSAYHHEVSVKVNTKMDIEDSIKTGAEGDIERDTKSDIDSDILANIEADIAHDAANTIDADASDWCSSNSEGVSRARETFEIGLDVVIQQLYDHMLEFPAQRIANIKEEQRTLEVMAITVDTKRNRMLERISVLEGSVMRLRETLTMERERTASVEHCLGYVTEELRRIRLTYQYNKIEI
ncbi:hypothetical protein Tco_0751233 [Tanacetum coccineum]|uniref:Uncharacterized protein n=1 Tax=Tanacetum coccineum TaxID=301880 RepID=A0ABQ4Z4A1_9ASTR